MIIYFSIFPDRTDSFQLCERKYERKLNIFYFKGQRRTCDCSWKIITNSTQIILGEGFVGLKRSD